MHANGRKTYHQMLENNTGWWVNLIGSARRWSATADITVSAQTSFSNVCTDG